MHLKTDEFGDQTLYAGADQTKPLLKLAPPPHNQFLRFHGAAYLTRAEVAELVGRLKAWLETGSLAAEPLPPEEEKAPAATDGSYYHRYDCPFCSKSTFAAPADRGFEGIHCLCGLLLDAWTLATEGERLSYLAQLKGSAYQRED